ncbi:MAG: hypothetical protein JW810_11725 [Sedimentisphaerales bacterium]|nr:hypothetical protein [Sedimentisphaerales bacterium]
MTELQKNILRIIQRRFPVATRPYAELAAELAASETDVLEAVRRLADDGIIRRIGAVFEAARLGYVSTLAAAQVPAERLEAFVARLNALPGVSHNYGRRHRLNVWFTLTVRHEESIARILDDLQAGFDLETIHSLPSIRRFKIRVEFDPDRSPPNASGPVEDAGESDRGLREPACRAGEPAAVFTDDQKELVRRLQNGLDITTNEPFAAVAAVAHMDPDQVLRQINRWQADGTIRRFGASLRHERIGYTANGMAVFALEPARIEAAGRRLVGYRSVSHCYQRPLAAGWPYNLFAMTHCRSEEQLQQTVREMAERIRPRAYEVLVTQAEYKKTSVKYFEPEQGNHDG